MISSSGLLRFRKWRKLNLRNNEGAVHRPPRLEMPFNVHLIDRCSLKFFVDTKITKPITSIKQHSLLLTISTITTDFSFFPIAFGISVIRMWDVNSILQALLAEIGTVAQVWNHCFRCIHAKKRESICFNGRFNLMDGTRFERSWKLSKYDYVLKHSCSWKNGMLNALAAAAERAIWMGVSCIVFVIFMDQIRSVGNVQPTK